VLVCVLLLPLLLPLLLLQRLQCVQARAAGWGATRAARERTRCSCRTRPVGGAAGARA
jgi:hypothetical protein